jgi:CheY-like chemotaxis protein
MVVEDNVRVRNALHEQLKDLGYSVLCEETATQAVLDIADVKRGGKRLDLLITDVVMPELNGPDLVQKLRQVQPSLRVLYITGYASQQILPTDALGMGTDLLHKPFTQRELDLKIHSLLAPKCEAQSA